MCLDEKEIELVLSFKGIKETDTGNYSCTTANGTQLYSIYVFVADPERKFRHYLRHSDDITNFNDAILFDMSMTSEQLIKVFIGSYFSALVSTEIYRKIVN